MKKDPGSEIEPTFERALGRLSPAPLFQLFHGRKVNSYTLDSYLA